LGGSLPAGRQGIFARLLCRAKRGWGWERLRSLAPSREAKQNIFQSHLEENLARASLKEKEKNVLLCAAVRRAEPRGGVCARHGADCRSKKVRAKCIITAPKLTLSELTAPLAVRAADGSLRKIKSAFVFAVKSQSSLQ